MDRFNITEVRQNASKIIAMVIENKVPVMVLQRSKPVAYIIEAKAFEDIQDTLEKAKKYEKTVAAKDTLKRLADLRNRTKVQPDSTPIIRQLREGELRRDE